MTGADPWNSRDGFRAIAGHPAASCRVFFGRSKLVIGTCCGFRAEGLKGLGFRGVGFRVQGLGVIGTCFVFSLIGSHSGLLFRYQLWLLAGQGPGLESESGVAREPNTP